VLFTGPESLVPLIDLVFMVGTVTWVDDQTTLDQLLPPSGNSSAGSPEPPRRFVKRLASAGGFVGVLLCAASPLPAQLAEVQIGVVASYGFRRSVQTRGGLVLGIAPGRLTYAGLRWTYYPGPLDKG